MANIADASVEKVVDASVEKVVDLLVDPLFNCVKPHVDYVIRYKNKFQLLEQENKTLGEKRKRIEGMVDGARNSGKIIKTEVSSWLEKAEQMQGDITNFLPPQENREYLFNLMLRHKMGKEAEEKKPGVTELISKTGELEKLPVAHDAPFQWEPQF